MSGVNGWMESVDRPVVLSELPRCLEKPQPFYCFPIREKYPVVGTCTIWLREPPGLARYCKRGLPRGRLHATH